MHIIEVKRFSEDKLIENLRKVTMLKAPEVKIYTRSFISLERISTQSLSPPQNYILREELKKVRELKWALEQHDVDIFELNGFVRLTLEEYPEPVDLLPPIVEESIERDGSVHLIINDGMHRVYMAMREWVIPQVVLIRGIPKDLPYYAFLCRGVGRILRRGMISRPVISKNGTGLRTIMPCIATSTQRSAMWEVPGSLFRK